MDRVCFYPELTGAKKEDGHCPGLESDIAFDLAGIKRQDREVIESWGVCPVFSKPEQCPMHLFYTIFLFLFCLFIS